MVLVTLESHQKTKKLKSMGDFENRRSSKKTEREAPEGIIFPCTKKNNLREKSRNIVKAVRRKNMHDENIPPNESILEQVQNETNKNITSPKSINKKRKLINDANKSLEEITVQKAIKHTRIDTTGNCTGVSTISKASDDSTLDEVKSVLGANFTASPTIKQEIHSLNCSFPKLESSYRIFSKIGEGTFSTVYLGQRIIDTKKDRNNNNNISNGHNTINKKKTTLVALKRIYVTSSPQRIFNELHLLYNLRGCDNVAPLLDVLRYEDQVIAVLPYYQHSDFRDFYRDLPLIGIKKYMFDLFSALKFIHKKGIMHRDIKPTNFLYNPFSRKGILVDFGLAEIHTEPISNKCPCSDSSNISSLRQLTNQFPKDGYLKDDQRPGRRANRAGTRGFRAPEVLFKCNNQSTMIDIWSAGVMLLTLLTRRFPFFNSTDDIEAIMEITTIFGVSSMKECAALHGLEFDCNIPKIKEKLSLEALVANCVSIDCKEGDTFADDSPAWELLSAIDKRGVFADTPLGQEYKEAFDILKVSLELDPKERFKASQILEFPFFNDFNNNL